MQSKPKSKINLELDAGGIIFRQTPRGTEIAFILDPYHKWTFAKGHIKKGESQVVAALREVSEEMGVPKNKLKIVAPLGSVDWCFREKLTGRPSPKGSLVHKFVYFFLMQVSADIYLKPQAQERIHSIKWVPLSEAQKSSSYKDIDQVLQKAIKILKKGNELGN